jgi:hypothetical protein
MEERYSLALEAVAKSIKDLGINLRMTRRKNNMQ